MGARAFSHDSIFIPDGGAESEQTVQAMSQDNILGKVKTLQREELYYGNHRIRKAENPAGDFEQRGSELPCLS
ncbi:capping protein-inhibiting regulator of actin dynamics isoform 5 [Mus musculus]|uniref:Capping protein inhibiting regulator of actin n=1 Tax=Mus musculus TaxID=10090 RepID=D3YTS2_MOUSE|nr:capping protein-inhibiting regulator of actin dynamics isoform 5 [Mus musculus]NP_001395609.1 capping protein-inhibiting regulator of actin dynamics isoform 5 [Mus musculus]